MENPTSPTLKGRYVYQSSWGWRYDLSPPVNQESFKGEIFHTAEFVNAKNNVGKKVVIIGTGVSAHDVAADHVENGVSEIVRYPPVWLS